MVTELHDVECEKKRRKKQTQNFFVDYPPEYPKYNSWKSLTIEMNNTLYFLQKVTEFQDTANPLLIDKCQ